MSTTFNHELRGPWPQPSPIRPLGLPPAVVHVPWPEQVDFAVHVMTRLHMTSLMYQPVAHLWALANPCLEPVTDDEFTSLLADGPFSRFLCPTFDPPDRAAFAPWLDGPGTFYKADFSAMARIPPMDGTYVAATVTLIERASPDAPARVHAMRIGDMVLQPGDGPAWELAKYFALQGATTHTVLGGHACLHFPMDSINAITKTAVPHDHPLYQLLEPHFRFSLALDDGVLHHPRTLLHNDQRESFTPLTAEGYHLLEPCYQGIPGNSAYPPYRFPLRPASPPSAYGPFLRGYYDVIRAFVAEVVAELSPHDPVVADWAAHVSRWVPGFPDESAIADPDVLADALAYIIADVTVMHAADHYSYAAQPITKLPFRLRVPPPTSRDMPAFDRTRLVTHDDLFRHKMAHEMFFKPSNVTLLADVVYAFESPRLREANRRFRQALARHDAELTGPRYVPLREIAASIQY